MCICYVTAKCDFGSYYTPWCNVFFCEFPVHCVIKKLIVYLCGIQSFIESHPWTSAVYSFMLRVFFRLCLVLPSFFPLRFSHLGVVWIPYPLHTTYYVHLILLGLISLPAVRSVCNFYCPVFFFFYLFIFFTCSLQHMFSNIFSVFSFFRVRETRFYTHINSSHVVLYDTFFSLPVTLLLFSSCELSQMAGGGFLLY
jgi:hypothetical protein